MKRRSCFVHFLDIELVRLSLAAIQRKGQTMSVYKRNRRWWYDFTINKIRYRKPIPEALNKKKAEEIESRKKNAVYEGTYEQKKPCTFAEFTKSEYQPFAESNYRSKSYIGTIKILIAFFGKFQLRDISPLLIEKFKRERQNRETRFNRPRADASVTHELSCLSKILSLAVDSGLIRANPCSKVKKLRVRNERDRVLTYDEQTLLLSEMAPMMRRITIFALNTGLRRGEIAALDWSDIDDQSNAIRLLETKSGKARTVPLNEKARAACGARKIGRVFGWTASTMTQKFTQARDAAKLPDIHFHDLRHTFATRLGLNGVDVFTIAEILGHSDIKMTRRYTHTNAETKAKAVQMLESCHKSVTNLQERMLKTG